MPRQKPAARGKPQRQTTSNQKKIAPMSPPPDSARPTKSTNTITIDPGSSAFLFAEDGKNDIRVVLKLQKATTAEKFASAIKSGVKALLGEHPKAFSPSDATSKLATVIDPKRLSDKQHKKMADELVRTNRAAQSHGQSVTRMRARGTFALAAICVGMAAWVWQTGCRDILMELAKAKEPKADGN